MSKAWLQDLEEKVQEAASRLREQKAANQELEERCARLEEKVEELEGRLAENETGDDGAEWQEERQEIRERVEKLVDHLTDLLAEES